MRPLQSRERDRETGGAALARKGVLAAGPVCYNWPAAIEQVGDSARVRC